MAKTQANLTAAETFIRETLEKNFKQRVAPHVLREAAKKLCDALPEPKKSRSPGHEGDSMAANGSSAAHARPKGRPAPCKIALGKRPRIFIG